MARSPTTPPRCGPCHLVWFAALAWVAPAPATAVSWRPVPSPVAAALLAVAAAPAGGFVAVGEGGVIVTSADGERWHAASSPTSTTLRGVACGPPACVAVGDGGIILTSLDGETWVQRNSGTIGRLNAVAWTGQRFVAVGAAGSEALSGVILASEDGYIWSEHTPGNVKPLYGVAGDDAQALAVGWTGAVAESPDGVTWTASSLGEVLQECWFMLRPSFLYAVAGRAGHWVAVGLVVGDQYPGAGVSLARQRGGEGWACSVTELPPLQFKFRAVAATPSGFVAAGLGGIAESRDGLTWEPQLAVPSPHLYGIAAGPSHWVAVGEQGAIYVRDGFLPRPLRRVVRVRNRVSRLDGQRENLLSLTPKGRAQGGAAPVGFARSRELPWHTGATSWMSTSAISPFPSAKSMCASW